MKSKYISRQNGRTRLLLIYAGWGMDWRPFAELNHPSYDIMVIWDYRDLTFNWGPLFKYDEVCLLAWSMGVFAASVTIHEIEPRITLRIAVNGTLDPIDDKMGIPPAIWHGTLNALSPSTWRKFQRRMCTSAQQFNAFREHAPVRTIADLAEELVALENHTIFHAEQVTGWDMAIIGKEDAIFPYDNQLRAWKGTAPTRVMDAGHLPDFSMMIERLLKDKDKVARRFNRASQTYEQSATVQRQVANRLMLCFDSIFGGGPIVGNVIEAGVGHEGFLTRQWIDRTDPRCRIRLWDIADTELPGIELPNVSAERCDAEISIKRQPSSSVGFIFSSSTVQWFNSPRDFLKECARVLVPGGYMALSSFTRENMWQITSLAGSGLQLPTASGWRGMVPKELEVSLIETDTIDMTFDTPRQVLEHLRHTGVTGVNFGKSPVAIVKQLLTSYPVNEETGKYHLTYTPVYMILHRPDE